MKKILLAIMLLTSLLVISGCGSKKLPGLTNPEEAYLTAKEGDFTYTITNQQIYEKLKRQVGSNILLDMIDEDLLKATKRSNNVSYWDSISEEDIMKDLELDIFPNDNKDDLSDDEVQEKTDEYYKQLFINYGLNDLEEIKEFYHMNLAKNLYAKDIVTATYDETDFTDTEYKTFYNNNFKKGYYAIIVSYESIRLYENALEQLGIKIANGVWTKISDSTALTNQEIVKAFIDLYNMNNSYKTDNYPESTLVINEGTEYSIKNGEIVFDLTKSDDLFYTNEKIKLYQSEIITLLDNTLTTYPEGNNWYTKNAQVYQQGSRYTFVLEIGEKVTDFESVKSEIREKLIIGKLTSTYIQTEMAKLRQENNIIIYDNDIEKKYVSTVETYNLTHKTTKKTHSSLVAKVGEQTYSADELFAEMNKSYGISLTATELERIRFLVNTNFNTIYDYNSSSKNENDKILNATEWASIKQEISDEKTRFEDNVYADYGYPATYGWENFLLNIYGVKSEDELIHYYLYLNIKEKYTNSLNDVKGKTVDDDLWKFYESQMTKMADEYFNVTGVHFLILVNDESSKPIHPDNWTAYQRSLAEEMYDAVMNYLNTNTTKSYVDKLKALESAYNKAPRFLPGLNQTTEDQVPLSNASYTFNGIEISKYKTAGLSVKYEDLGIINNGEMVKEFDEAVRSIWKANPSSTTPTIYGYNSGAHDYLVTEFGFHIYVNLTSTPIPTWEENKVTPTLEQILIYLEDPTDKRLTTKIKTAISTYFDPIQNELKSANNFTVNIFEDFKEIGLTFTHQDYSNEEFIKYLDYKIESANANLKYK